MRDWNEDDVEAVMEERVLCYPYLRRGENGVKDKDSGRGEKGGDDD